MSEPGYRDLLWDLTFEPTGSKGAVHLLIASTEQELFDAKAQSAKGEHLALDASWLSSSARQEVGKTRGDETVSLQGLRDLGQRLWEAVPLPAKQPLLEASPERPWRLKISSNHSALDDLPWEWLNDGTGPPFALRPDVRLARSVPIRLPIPPLTVSPPIRVLLVLTNPKDEWLLDPGREIDAVRSRLDAPPYELQILWEPTQEALTAELGREPHVVHYIGHAGIAHGEGNIILHDDRSVTHWVSGPELAQVLPLSVRLICLSTCFTVSNYQILGLSRVAHTSAHHRLPTMVTNRYPIAESDVRVFWEEFYDALVSFQGNANEAFHLAQRAAAERLETETGWGSFSLVIRDQTAEVLRLSADRPRSAERYAEEVQAQLAAGLANDLASQLSTFGAAAPESVVQQFEEEAATASDLTEGLARLD
jgi:hypothetical protein